VNSVVRWSLVFRCVAGRRSLSVSTYTVHTIIKALSPVISTSTPVCRQPVQVSSTGSVLQRNVAFSSTHRKTGVRSRRFRRKLGASNDSGGWGI